MHNQRRTEPLICTDEFEIGPAAVKAILVNFGRGTAEASSTELPGTEREGDRPSAESIYDAEDLETARQEALAIQEESETDDADVSFDPAEFGDGYVGLRSTPSDKNLLDAIIASDGEVDYEQVTDVARRIENGELEIRRLDPAGEFGRQAGGRRNVEASFILRASEATDSAAPRRSGSHLEARQAEQSR